MKLRHKLKTLLAGLMLVVSGSTMAQDSTQPEISVNIHYMVVNNSFQYLAIETKTKVDKKWKPLRGVVLQLYLDSNKAENLINKVRTDSDGKAKAIIPPTLKSAWDAASTHKFIAVTEGSSKEEETATEVEISKSKISIDTANEDGVRMVNVSIFKWENNDWVAVKDVDVKIGVQRLGGVLPIGDEENYTTDSTGQAHGEFKRDSLPGNKNGQLVLIAKVEDNDQFGSLSIEKPVPWGKYMQPQNKFGERALWAAKGKAPIWLMLMAYSIMAAVWAVIVYLIFQIVAIARLGKNKTNKIPTPSAIGR